MPEYFALITRALIVLEGIALTGDKDFDLFEAAYPLVANHATRLFGARELAVLLGEARQAEKSLKADAKAVLVEEEREAAARQQGSGSRGASDAVRRGISRTLTSGRPAWC